MKNKLYVILLILVLFGLSGCSSYRSHSGLTVPEQKNIQPNILVTQKSLNNKDCETIQFVNASVKKLTLFHDDPTKNQVDYILAKKGQYLGANAIRNVIYTFGTGFTTWGYIDAKGEASKCNLNK